MKMGRRKKYPRHLRRLYEAIDQLIISRTIWDEKTYGVSKNTLCLSMVSVLLLFLISCVSQQNRSVAADNLSDEEHAQHALMGFLEDLHNGKYAEAAQFYGGSYETMIDHNPDINPNDHATLLRNACTLNGMQCFRGKIIGLEEKESDAKYVFMVEFRKDDGTLFALGPCCGSDQTSTPPQSVFLFTVIKVYQNEFIVMDMPPYVL